MKKITPAHVETILLRYWEMRESSGHKDGPDTGPRYGTRPDLEFISTVGLKLEQCPLRFLARNGTITIAEMWLEAHCMAEWLRNRRAEAERSRRMARHGTREYQKLRHLERELDNDLTVWSSLEDKLHAKPMYENTVAWLADAFTCCVRADPAFSVYAAMSD